MINGQFDAEFQHYRTLLEEELSQRMLVPDAPYHTVAEAMRYSLLSGGKRIRGVLTLAAYHLFDDEVEKVLPFAAAIEMVHAYSLIHDDLPCMDDDAMRRGKPSCHIAYGEAAALLAGDGLLTLAFETALSAEGFAPQSVQAAATCLAKAAGMHGMIGGQMMDLENEGRSLTAEELDGINRRKTGALFRVCVEMACALGGADAKQQEALCRYTDAVGLAFQIVDDLLDVTADPTVLGKPTGSDVRSDKQTYVAIYGQQRSRERVQALHTQAKQALCALPKEKTAFLYALVNQLADRVY